MVRLSLDHGLPRPSLRAILHSQILRLQGRATYHPHLFMRNAILNRLAVVPKEWRTLNLLMLIHPKLRLLPRKPLIVSTTTMIRPQRLQPLSATKGCNRLAANLDQKHMVQTHKMLWLQGTKQPARWQASFGTIWTNAIRQSISRH